ncbi:MAG: threonine ammonia-lyase [Candidatus Hodarchaeales archaeon]|jgi:threonine dehydratase
MSLTLSAFNKALKRLENIAHNTPVLTSNTFNKLTGYKVYLKCENFQKMGAFKFRGAYNALKKLSEDEKGGVITHSSGNHAQAIALAGKLLGMKTVIVMPKNAPKVKINATLGYGAEVVFCEPTVSSREKKTHEIIKQKGYTFIHPYDNLNVIEGAGTACLELLNREGKFDAVIAPIGGGGLLSGTSIVGKLSGLVTKIYGAEPINANDAYLSFKAGYIIPQTNPNTIADGLRTSLSELTFKFIRQYVDDILIVSESQILEAMQFLWERMKIVVEPSGAVPVAVLMDEKCPIKKNSKVGVIISGGNIDLTSFFACLNKKIQ